MKLKRRVAGGSGWTSCNATLAAALDPCVQARGANAATPLTGSSRAALHQLEQPVQMSIRLGLSDQRVLFSAGLPCYVLDTSRHESLLVLTNGYTPGQSGRLGTIKEAEHGFSKRIVD